MRERVYNPAHHAYANYGARGVTICDRWDGPDGFPNFLADMGEPPAGMSLDRIDNDGSYSPDNCRWATAKDQGRNRRTTKLTPDDAATIRRRRAMGEFCRVIAADYGITPQTVGKIANGIRWA